MAVQSSCMFLRRSGKIVVHSENGVWALAEGYSREVPLPSIGRKTPISRICPPTLA